MATWCKTVFPPIVKEEPVHFPFQVEPKVSVEPLRKMNERKPRLSQKVKTSLHLVVLHSLKLDLSVMTKN